MPLISRACFLSCLIVLVSIDVVGSVEVQQLTPRLVIGTDVVCRAAPNSSAPVVHSYVLGDFVGVTKESGEEGGHWYFDQWRVSGASPTCWVYGPLTAEFVHPNLEPALLAVADHVLQRTDQVRFEDYVAVDNLLTYDYSSVLASSGLLQFRRLSVIEKAIALPTATRQLVAKDPLMRAWLSSHQELLKFFSPAARWYMQPEAYWDLYEKYKHAPWAEELAWAAAQLYIPGDECYANCMLQKIHRTLQQYWTRFPGGASVTEAVGKAARMTKYASQVVCEDDPPVPRPFLDEMRTSLAGVTAPGKGELLGFLNELEQAQTKCRR